MGMKQGLFAVFLVFLTAIAGCSDKHSASDARSGNNSSNNITINDVSPGTGYADTGIVLSGSGFGSTQGTVKFGDIEITASAWSDTEIQVIVPDITSGTVKLSVVSGIKTSNAKDFTVMPFLSGIDKADVMLNDVMMIQGTGFGTNQGGSTVDYAGTVLPVSAWSNNHITAAVGNITHAATGMINVVVNNNVSNGIPLTLHPSITSLSPDTAERGDEVSIAGNLFGVNQGTSSVTFSGIPATVISWADNLIKTKVPDNAVKGGVVVSVNGIASSAQGFTVTKIFYSINQPTGLAMDESGNMYVANYNDGTIIKVLPGGLTQTTIYKGLNKPLGLYYAPSSILYVACEGDGTVQKLILGNPVTGYTFASGFSMPAGIAFDDAGNTYVTNYGNNTISKVDLNDAVSTFATGLNKPMGIVFTGPSGGKTFKVVNNGNGTISVVDLMGVVLTFVSNLVSPRYIISDSDYSLYVTSNDNVIREVTLSGSTFTYAVGLSDPFGLVMDNNGSVYAANHDTNSISKVNNSFQVYAQGFYKPWGITFSTSGTMFVANQGSEATGGGSISMVTTEGRVLPFINPLDRSACTASHIISPKGITTGFQNNLFVAPSISSLAGYYISSITYTGNASVFGGCSIQSFFFTPWGIAFSHQAGLLYVTDHIGIVFTATSDGKRYFFASVGYKPEGIALDANGNVYIANSAGNSISMVTAAGTVTTTYASGFSMPSDIKLDGKGELFVSNYGGNSVSIVTPANGAGVFAKGIQNPTGIAIDESGGLYVASESDGKIYRLIHTVSGYVSGLNAPEAMVRGNDGFVYASDSSNNSIYRISSIDTITTFASGITSVSWFAFDNAGNVLLTNFLDGTLLRISGNNVNVFASGFSGPTGIAADNTNNLYYVMNYLNNTVSIVTSSGVVSTFAVGLSGPMGAAFLSPGNLYAANNHNGTIAKVVQGSGVSVFASGFILPMGLALDDQHNLYITDQAAGIVYRSDPAGTVLPFASVASPFGIAFDGNGNLFVSDTADKQIKEIVLQ